MTDSQIPPDIGVDFPIPSGLKVPREQPYYLLVVGDFAGLAGRVNGELAGGVTYVNACNFDEVMADASPQVTFTAASPLDAKGAMIEVALRFPSLKSFQPGDLAQQFPATATLMALRGQLADRLHARMTAVSLKTAIERAAKSDPALSWLAASLAWTPAAANSAAVDDILGQIDLGDGGATTETPAKPPRSAIGSAVAAAAGAAAEVPAQEASALRKTIAEIDRRLNTWLNFLLHAPQVQAIEAAWRSLAFLVSHTDFRKGVRVGLLHASAADRLARFREKVIDPVFDQGELSPDVIVVDVQYGNTAPDLEALDEWAQHGASLPAVVLAGIGAPFFGVKNAWQMPTLPPLVGLMDQWQFAKWKTLRQQSYARYLAPIFGRGLLRPNYTRGEANDGDFAFVEDVQADKDLPWINGPLVAACAIARSFADTGWPAAMAGMVHGRVETFALAKGGPKGDKVFGPGDIALAQQKIDELAVAGANATLALRDSTDLIVYNGLTAARPTRMEPGALLEVSLPYQLFATRLSALLFLLKPHLAGLPAEGIAKFVTDHARDWLNLSGEVGEAIRVQTKPGDDNAKALDLAVTITPPANILPGGIPLVMGYCIG